MRTLSFFVLPVLPRAWLQQCLDVCESAAAAAALTVLSLVTKRLGWRLSVPPYNGRGNVGQPVNLSQLMVKTGTTLQLGPATTAQRMEHTTYVRLALGLPFDIRLDTAEVAAFAAKLPATWRLEWENVDAEAGGCQRCAWGKQAGAFKCCGCSTIATPDDTRLHFLGGFPVAAELVRSTITTAIGTERA